MWLSSKKMSKERMTTGSRRLFFSQMGAVIAGGVFLPSVFAAKNRPASTAQPGDSNMTSSKTNEFSPFVGDQFKISTEDRQILGLKLVEVTDRSEQVNTVGDEKRQECFSMIFQGPSDSPLDQKTYAFEHPGMGQFDLFIVPIGQRDNVIDYEAVINRIVG